MNLCDWGGPGFGFMWIFPLLFFIVLLFFMRGMPGQGNNTRSGSGSNNTPTESARDILDKRFAKGEINKEEYEEMKKTLSRDSF